MSVVEEENSSSYNIWVLRLGFRDLYWTFGVTYCVFTSVFSHWKAPNTKKNRY